MYRVLLGKMFVHTRSFGRGMFWQYFKPPLSGYDVCAAMCSRYLAVPRIVASGLISSLFDQIRCVSKLNFEEKVLKVPIISEFLC